MSRVTLDINPPFFLTMCICAFSLIMHMRRDNKKTRMRFWAQTGDLGLEVEKNNEGHF